MLKKMEGYKMTNKKCEIVIIGGGPAAVVAAGTAKKYYSDKKVTMIMKHKTGVIPCGIPYMFHSLEKPEDNIMGYAPLEKAGVELIADEVIEINREEKRLTTKSGRHLCYEKLILALGSRPITPRIPGFDSEGIYPIRKNFDYLVKMIEDVKKSKRILILGGGFIGVEFADELSKFEDKEITLVEMQPNILSNSFDPEFSQLAAEKLAEKGIKVLTGVKVLGFNAENGRVKSVKLSNNEELEVDSVISGIGALPNTNLATHAGLDLGKGKGIWVDEYMRTSDPDIFAIGDCSGKRDFFTRRDLSVMLASTATAEARVAGASLYNLKVIRENKGTIAVFSTYIDNLALGSAGMTETTTRREGFEIITGEAHAFDKHPGKLPNASKVTVKLVFTSQSGVILGGQISGGASVGEMINVISTAIQKKMSITELETLQMATHPMLTAAPTIYPIVVAAIDAGRKL